jgi:hypothetical protein
MDRLDMAIELILEAQEEKNRLIDFERDYNEALTKDNEAHSWENRDKVYRAYSPTPKKSVVNDNLKMARRIIIGEYMK